MKMKEILEKETNQLRNELAEQQKHLFELRSQAVTEKLEDPSQLGKTKKTIARILTVLRQREPQGQNGHDTQKAEQPAAEGEGAEKTTKPATPRARKPAARGGKKKAAAKKPAPKKKAPAKKGGTKTPTKARKPAAKKAARKSKAAAGT